MLQFPLVKGLCIRDMFVRFSRIVIVFVAFPLDKVFDLSISDTLFEDLFDCVFNFLYLWLCTRECIGFVKGNVSLYLDSLVCLIV